MERPQTPHRFGAELRRARLENRDSQFSQEKRQYFGIILYMEKEHKRLLDVKKREYFSIHTYKWNHTTQTKDTISENGVRKHTAEQEIWYIAFQLLGFAWFECFAFPAAKYCPLPTCFLPLSEPEQQEIRLGTNELG